MEQTAVDWLMPKILELSLQLSLSRISQRTCELEILKLFQQAKEMEREQIEIAYNTGGINEACDYIDQECGIESDKLSATYYYNKTFKQD